MSEEKSSGNMPINPAKFITGNVRFSYLHVFEAVTIGDEEGEKKFSASILIPKSDKATLAKVNAAIAAAIESGKNSKFGGKVPAKLKTPLRDGDEERGDDEAYVGHMFLNATCKTKPGIVDRALNEIMDKDELYSGCYGRASLTMYPFDTKGNKGIACGLNNVMKLADGGNLAGRVSAKQDFAGLEEEDDLF